MDFLVHEDNLTAKIRRNYKGRGDEFERFKNDVYIPYKTEQLKIKGITKEHIFKKVQLLETYFREVDAFNKGGWIRAQSKFRPTVLEEFCGYLFKDLPEVGSLGLAFFKRKIYTGLDIDKEGKVRIRTKDIDFCVGKAVTAKFAGEQYEIKIPLVGVECKTYVDNTMFSEAQFTAQKLKGGAPEVKVFIIAERNEIDINQLPSQSPVDQIYILRDKLDSPIEAEVVWEFFNEVKSVKKG